MSDIEINPIYFRDHARFVPDLGVIGGTPINCKQKWKELQRQK
jgi:hypothetical protein